MKGFDYYIFIDYSVNLIGYMIIEKCKIREFIAKIGKFGHYNELKHKSSYLKSIKKVIEKNNILSYLLKTKIRKRVQNIEIYADVLEFLKSHENCIIFVSIDNHEYPNFKKLVNVVDGSKTEVVQESQLGKNTPEYRMSLVLDTLLNIERLKDDRIKN